MNAAKLAAQLSSEASKRSELERRRMYIFATFMGARRSVYSAEVVTMFNLIDIVFHDCPDVRHAWAELYNAYHDQRLNNPQGYAVRDEKFNTLLFRIAQVLEIGADLRLEDINRVYIPEALYKAAMIEMHQRDRLFDELQQTPESEKAATPAPQSSKAFKTAPR